jgi:hypothetical protein
MRMSTIAVALFCMFLTGLTVWNCWVKPDTNKYKIIASLITICTGVTGFFVLRQMMPSPASPQINDLYIFAHGKTNSFYFCCEFMVRNDGATPCNLEKVEFVLSDVKFRIAKTAQLEAGAGGGGNSTPFGGGGGRISNIIASSFFPQSISSINQSFKIVGEGKNETIKDEEAKNFAESEINVLVKLYFNSKDKHFIIERNIPVIYRLVSGIRF